MRSRGADTWQVGRLLPWSAGAVAVVICLLAYQLGYSMLASWKLQQEREIAVETNAVCARLGHPRGQDGFFTCMLELDGVRQHERARIAVEESALP